ncbi:MAG: hypothetical protein LBQ60_13135 [Bacteroidales bacterium]|jgi:hypothetical protein|nr:hypothetical protein [Bacteroidales bacterium]
MKKIFCFILSALLINGLMSCNKSDDSEKRDSDFDVPELTASNTIQFTVNTKANDYAYVILNGGKIAVDWGDREVTKDKNPGNGEPWRMEFTHVYKKAGEYRVKIWTDEITFINLYSLIKEYYDLHVGNCPELKDAVFNSFSRDQSINLNGCKKLETLNLGNWEQLGSVVLDECLLLEKLQVYTHPGLTGIDLSKNNNLHSLEITDCGIEELKLPKSIVNASCMRNNLKSLVIQDNKNLSIINCNGNEELVVLDLTGCDNLTYIGFSKTKIDLFDFSIFPELTFIDCSNSGLITVDVSGNNKLGNLSCSGLDLESLNITNNTSLLALNCGGNNLTGLDVSKNTGIRYLYINNNEFEKESLEEIFKDLPVFDPSLKKSNMPSPQPSEIKIYDNPGTAECDTKIITDKGWIIKSKEGQAAE